MFNQLNLSIMSTYRQVIRDKRVINAVLRKARKEEEKRLGHAIPSGTFAYPSQWGYLEECGDWDSYNLTSFHGIEYKGKRYGTKYFDGCFKPFVVEECPRVSVLMVSFKNAEFEGNTVRCFEDYKMRNYALEKDIQDYKREFPDAEITEKGRYTWARRPNGEYCQWVKDVAYVE